MAQAWSGPAMTGPAIRLRPHSPVAPVPVMPVTVAPSPVAVTPSPMPVAPSPVPMTPVMVSPMMAPTHLDGPDAIDFLLREDRWFRCPGKCGLDILLRGDRRHRCSLRRGSKCQRRGADSQCNGETQKLSALHDFLLHLQIVMLEEVSQLQNEWTLNPMFRLWRNCHCLRQTQSVCARAFASRILKFFTRLAVLT